MMDTAIVKIGGMSCGGCVQSITGVLKALSGVGKVDVSLEKGEASIEFDPDRITREALLGAIDDAGFEAS